MSLSDPDISGGCNDRYHVSRLAKSHSKRTVHPPLLHMDSPDQASMLPTTTDIEAMKFISSPLHVWKIIASFDDCKRRIVQSIGFGGLLSLPCFKAENKSFSFWLLYKMKWHTASIAVGENIRLTLNEDHIGKITGLPTAGTDISMTRLRTVDDKLAFMKSRLSFLGSESGILDAAEEFVQRELPGICSKTDCDNFKLAFVIFIIGRFLAPSNDNADGNTNFWGALQSPEAIQSFNWSFYILQNVKLAARYVNWSSPTNNPLTTVLGCPLILQIFYLDNIDFGVLNTIHDLLPRWASFSDNRINAMLSADISLTDNCSTASQFGRIQAIRQGSTCYISPYVTSSSTTPTATTPSKRICPSRPRISPRQNSTTPYQSDDDAGLHNNFDSSLTDYSNSIPNIDFNVIDFNSFIQKKYHGQVDSKLLDDLRIYNATCLNHITNSYRGVVSAVVDQNIKMATRLLEHHIFHGNQNNNCQPLSKLPPRRWKGNDFLAANDSSTEGEDNPILFKSPAINLPLCDSPSSSLACQRAGLTTSPDAVGQSKVIDGNDVLRSTMHSYFMPQSTRMNSLTNRSTSMLHQHPSPATTYTTNYASPDGGHIEQSKLQPIGQLNLSDLVTPQATIKMCGLTSDHSPTEENTLFSGACLSARMLESIHGFDLNSASYDDDYHSLSVPKKNAFPGPACQSHFHLNLEIPENDQDASNALLQSLANNVSNDLDSNWLMHSIPRFIKISGKELKDQFVINKPMELDVFDAVIRRFNEIDRVIYGPVAPLRWRHLLEHDFAMHVLASEDPAENKPVRQQFIGPLVDYEVSRCRMFFTPVFVNGSWWCYSWDLQSSGVFIMDPTATSSKDDVIISRHIGSIQQISKSLSALTNDIFNGWAPNFTPAKYSVIRIPGMPYSSKASGLITLFAIWNFNGSNICAPATVANIADFKAFLLYQLMLIGNNTGRVPDYFNQKI